MTEVEEDAIGNGKLYHFLPLSQNILLALIIEGIHQFLNQMLVLLSQPAPLLKKAHLFGRQSHFVLHIKNWSSVIPIPRQRLSNAYLQLKISVEKAWSEKEGISGEQAEKTKRTPKKEPDKRYDKLL